MTGKAGCGLAIAVAIVLAIAGGLVVGTWRTRSRVPGTSVNFPAQPQPANPR